LSYEDGLAIIAALALWIVPTLLIVLGSWISFSNTEGIAGFRVRILKIGSVIGLIAAVSLAVALLRVVVFHRYGFYGWNVKLLQISALASLIALLLVLAGKGPGRVLLTCGALAWTIWWSSVVDAELLYPSEPQPQKFDRVIILNRQ
jgi:hypothetical protein